MLKQVQGRVQAQMLRRVQAQMLEQVHVMQQLQALH
jgi:hypothetical protein